MVLSHIRRLVPAVALGLAAVACGGGTPDGQTASDAPSIVRLDGSSTVFPISEAVAEEFQKVHPEMRVTVGISGTGGGFQRFCRGETDISNASRPISPVEIDACAAAGIGFIELPVAYDGIAIVVNPKATWVDTVTVDELRTIWEPAAQGSIMRWNQIRDGWPDRELRLFGAGVDSGTYDYFTDAIVGQEGASRGDFTSSEDDNVLVQGIANDELAIGFMPFAYYEENRDRLKLLGVDDGDAGNGAGPIRPDVVTIGDGTYQPLARPIFIYVSEASLSRPEVEQFVTFYIGEGGALAEEVGYVSLGTEGYALVAEHLRTRQLGTRFGEGGSQVGMTLEELLSRERSR